MDGEMQPLFPKTSVAAPVQRLLRRCLLHRGSPAAMALQSLHDRPDSDLAVVGDQPLDE